MRKLIVSLFKKFQRPFSRAGDRTPPLLEFAMVAMACGFTLPLLYQAGQSHSPQMGSAWATVALLVMTPVYIGYVLAESLRYREVPKKAFYAFSAAFDRIEAMRKIVKDPNMSKNPHAVRMLKESINLYEEALEVVATSSRSLIKAGDQDTLNEVSAAALGSLSRIEDALEMVKTLFQESQQVIDLSHKLKGLEPLRAASALEESISYSQGLAESAALTREELTRIMGLHLRDAEQTDPTPMRHHEG